MIRFAIFAAPALLLGACATNAPVTPEPAVPAPPVSEITYETEPCFGTCPVYAVTVSNRGTPGVFEGRNHTAVTGRREFRIQPADFNRFAIALADTRAAIQADYDQGGVNCREAATDHPSVRVTFREGSAAPRSFRFYYGCRDAAASKLGMDLKRAPTLLPIAAFIGKR